MKTLTTILPGIFNQIRQGATFLSIKKYEDNYGGLYNFGLVFHIDYIKAVKKSLQIISAYKPKDSIEESARLDLIQSFNDTLSGHNPRATSAHAYVGIQDKKKIPIKGVKWHIDGDAVHLYGFVVHRVELRPSNYPEDKRHYYTIIRKNLKALTPVDRFRQYKLVPGRFSTIGVESLTLTQKDLLRSIEGVRL